jgi:hypothetical protein
VAHFTSKAKVDSFVRDGGFASCTFVEAPLYFENLTGNLAPSPLPDGSAGWALPLPAHARVVHAGSIQNLGGVVAGAFDNPDVVGDGAYVSSGAALMSFEDIVDTFNAQGHAVAAMQVPAEVFATFSSRAPRRWPR